MKKGIVLMLIGVTAVLALVFAPLIGIKILPIGNYFRPFSGDMDAYILWKIRIPRVLTAFCAGTALSTSGMVFQAVFRNPLATPFTLGVSAGAAFGTALYLLVGFPVAFWGISGISLSSFLGALLSIMIVYGATRMKRRFTTATMLLAGVAVNFFFSSLILFIQYVSDFTQSFRIIRWLMGGFEIVGFNSFFSMVPFVVAGLGVVVYLMNELNLMSAGEDIAISRGVNVSAVKTVLFFATSLMIGGVVSICGPIGFVGMMSPHICRLLIGANHRYLAPASMLFGGTFLAICDALSRTIIAPAEIPVGVITALLGGPFFLWLLLGGLSERSMMQRS